jgi:hypothetical protein
MPVKPKVMLLAGLLMGVSPARLRCRKRQTAGRQSRW